jgi:acetyl esterase/lipase
VTYSIRDDRELKADIYVPEGQGPFPGVLMVHGGAWLVGNKRDMRAAARLVARHGYTVAAINYSLAPRHKFPAPVEDCKAAVRWLRKEAGRYKLDPERIAGYGYSAGGHLVSMLGVTESKDGLEGKSSEACPPSSRLQAVVAGGAPCDLEQIPRDVRFLAYFLGGSRGEVPEVYRRASPTTYASPDDPPFFFFHGESDSMVPRESPEALQARLEAAGVPTRFHTVEGKGHITAFLSQEPVERAIEFLDRHLKRGDG